MKTGRNGTSAKPAENLSGWERVGNYGLRKGEYRIAKVCVCGVWSYVLFHEWSRLGRYSSASEAMEAMKKHNVEGNRLAACGTSG